MCRAERAVTRAVTSAGTGAATREVAMTRWRVVCGVVVLAAALSACGDGADVVRPSTPAGPIGLTVLHGNDLWGETEPCG